MSSRLKVSEKLSFAAAFVDLADVSADLSTADGEMLWNDGGTLKMTSGFQYSASEFAIDTDLFVVDRVNEEIEISGKVALRPSISATGIIAYETDSATRKAFEFLSYTWGGASIFYSSGDARLRFAGQADNYINPSSGNLGVGLSTGISAKLHVANDADQSQPVAILQAHSTQTANIFEIQDSGGGVLTSINKDGHGEFSKLRFASQSVSAIYPALSCTTDSNTGFDIQSDQIFFKAGGGLRATLTKTLLDIEVDVTATGYIETGEYLGLTEQSADPSDPASGKSIIWQSDGTGSGDDGDIMMKITDSGGTTKTVTLVDYSAA